MARASVEDPLKVFRYRVVIDGFVRAGFTKVSGFGRDTEEASYREGAFNDTKQKSAGLTNFGDLTLTRGQIVQSQRGGDDDVVTWADDVFDITTSGNAANYRKDLDIEQYSASNVRARVWRVYECWVKGFKPMSDLDANASENSYEEMTIAHEGWERVL